MPLTTTVSPLSLGKFIIIIVRLKLFNAITFYRKPGLIFEPIEKSLDVTLRQECKPCFIIDIGPEEVCTINNLKLMLTGPNKELDMKAYQESVEFD